MSFQTGPPSLRMTPITAKIKQFMNEYVHFNELLSLSARLEPPHLALSYFLD